LTRPSGKALPHDHIIIGRKGHSSLLLIQGRPVSKGRGGKDGIFSVKIVGSGIVTPN
jgi:hypothetical protein